MGTLTLGVTFDPGTIQQLVAPAVMVPACGLLLLSSTARLNTVLARIRAFHNARLDVWREDADPATRAGKVRALRLDGLNLQTRRLLERAALLRATMILLFASLTCDLIAMLLLGARVVAPEGRLFYDASVGVFMLGVVVLLAAMGTSAVEVWRILETVRYEHGRVNALCDEEPTAGGARLDSDMGEGTAL